LQVLLETLWQNLIIYHRLMYFLFLKIGFSKGYIIWKADIPSCYVSLYLSNYCCHTGMSRKISLRCLVMSATTLNVALWHHLSRRLDIILKACRYWLLAIYMLNFAGRCSTCCWSFHKLLLLLLLYLFVNTIVYHGRTNIVRIYLILSW
jgi:hypothetical protein